MSLQNLFSLSYLRAASLAALLMLVSPVAHAGDVEDAFAAEEIAMSYALSEVDELPQPLEIVEPERSPDLMKERGLVRVALLINAEGKVVECRIVHSSNNALNTTAIKSALKWTFKPAIKDGKPVMVRVGQPIRFK